jgi:hypothetical protein
MGMERVYEENHHVMGCGGHPGDADLLNARRKGGWRTRTLALQRGAASHQHRRFNGIARFVATISGCGAGGSPHAHLRTAGDAALLPQLRFCSVAWAVDLFSFSSLYRK